MTSDIILMPELLTTERLNLRLPGLHDLAFFRELLNSEGWVRFIGDRNIHSDEAAAAYIEKIINDPNVQYRVACLKETGVGIGVITLIQRDYLDHLDIGFAFLPQYSGNGYAFEGAKAVLDIITRQPSREIIYAVTLPDNMSSIKLLKKLGLQFERELNQGGSLLHLFSNKQSEQ